MDDTEDTFEQFLSFCNYNPSHIVDKTSSSIPKFEKLNSFCDKHIDGPSFLQHVRLAPSLLSDISKSVDVALDAIKEKGQRLPPIRRSRYFPKEARRSRQEAQYTSVFDAAGIADRYADTIGTYCTLIASTLVFHPYASEWHTTFYFSSVLTRYRNFAIRDEDHAFLDRINKDLRPEFWSSLDDRTVEILRQITRRYTELAVWQMLTPDAERVLRDMDKWAEQAAQEFHHERCSTRGLTPSESILPHSVDATTTAWGTPMAAFVKSLTRNRNKRKKSNALHSGPVRRSQRLSALDRAKSQETRSLTHRSAQNLPKLKTPKWNVVTLLPRPDIRMSDGTSNTSDLTTSLIQHAWTLAVHRDSTFIVFNCGNYERIGFRHRETQTLFLSDLIDIPNSEDPAYGKIHIGLYVSILKDLIDRVSQYEEMEKIAEAPKNRKRKRDTSVQALDKRPRTRAYEALKIAEREAERRKKELSAMLRSELASRDVVLLEMRYGHYNSVAPAAMIRVGQSLHNGLNKDWKAPTISERYQPHQYCIVIITSEIAKGAVGFAYRGTVKILATDGHTMIHDVVVKLAFREDQRERMRHEYSIYEHLASTNVKGIPVVHGLFQDVESGVVALIMDDAGETILKRLDLEDPSVYHFTEYERAGFERILKDIHNAGVQHRDIRAENMTVDKDGNPYIIDFDRAKISQEKNATRREWSLLQGMFQGVHPEYERTTSPDSDDSHETENSFFAQFSDKEAALGSSSDDDSSDDDSEE